MDLKAVMGFLFYWLLLAALFEFAIVPGGGGLIAQNVSVNSTWESPTNTTITENTESNFWGQIGAVVGNIISLLAFLVFGIGLPASTPAWFAWLFGGLIFSVNVVLSVVIINSFWSGGGN